MKKYEKWKPISLIGIMLSVFLAWGIPYLWLRLLFVVCAVTISVLIHSRFKSWEKFCWYKYIDHIKVIAIFTNMAIMTIILIISIYKLGSFTSYMESLEYYMFYAETSNKIDRGESDEYVSEIKNLMDSTITQNNTDIQKLHEVYTQLVNTSSEVDELSNTLSKQQFWKEQYNLEEIEEIIQKINEEYSEWEDSFPNLKTDRKDIELFYK